MTSYPFQQQLVAIGGGNGLGRTLCAIQSLSYSVTGIVTTTDNGGSTGRIRHHHGGIAWGDTRNCLNQLITEPSLGSMLFDYRFRGNTELGGHNLGNIMLTALDQLSIRPLDAINLIRDFLKIDINLIPMSEHPADLTALSTQGEWIRGETNIDEMNCALKRVFVEPRVTAPIEATQAIDTADMIILGPGSFLTSVLPPLLISQIGRAIEANIHAQIVFIDNLATEPGPAGQMSIQEKLSWCQRACFGRPIDVVLTSDPHVELTTTECIHTSLASANYEWRHDCKKLLHVIASLIQQRNER